MRHRCDAANFTFTLDQKTHEKLVLAAAAHDMTLDELISALARDLIDDNGKFRLDDREVERIIAKAGRK